MTDFNENNRNLDENQVPGSNPVNDPYKTTGGNSGEWQGAPRQPNPESPGQYSYNPKTGWSGSQAGGGAPDYGSRYHNRQQGYSGEDYKWNFADYENSAGPAKKSGRKKRRGLMVFTGIVCGLFALALVSFAGYGVYKMVADHPAVEAAESQPGQTAQAVPGLNINDIPQTSDTISADGVLTPKQIGAKVRPSVVGIVNYKNNSNYYLYGYGGEENTLVTGEGSGIIMSSDGYIITNAHVVEGASGLKVVLFNGEEYDAKLIGSDPKTDLAVIKIEANNLTPAEFGDSNQIEVGEEVVAIGNPGGLEFSSSMSRGIVSGVNRALKNGDSSYTMNFIQTDAAINPGNSGGALVNEYGQVIGINSAKLAATEYEGMGFAIPISEAKPIIDDLIANGRVTGRVKLGITGRNIDETLARYNNVPTGFMVYTTEAGSDIAAKGVLAGDIITKIDGNPIDSSGDVADYLKDFKPGDKVTLTVFRRTSGKPDTTFEVTVTLMEDTGEAVTQQIVPQQQDGSNFFSFFG